MTGRAQAAAASRGVEFDRLVAITSRLKLHLERAEWGAAAELEGERRHLIEALFDVPPTTDELPALAAALREVVRINDELIGLAEHRRRALGRELDMLSAGRQATRAYGEMIRPVAGLRP